MATVLKPAARLPAHAAKVTCLAFSLDDSLLAAGGDDGTIDLWDVASKERLISYAGHSHTVSDISFNFELVSCSFDGTIKIWDIPLGTGLLQLEKRFANPVVGARLVTSDYFEGSYYGRESTLLAVCTCCGEIFLLDPTTGNEVSKGEKVGITECCCIDSFMKTAYAGCMDSKLRYATLEKEDRNDDDGCVSWDEGNNHAALRSDQDDSGSLGRILFDIAADCQPADIKSLAVSDDSFYFAASGSIPQADLFLKAVAKSKSDVLQHVQTSDPPCRGVLFLREISRGFNEHIATSFYNNKGNWQFIWTGHLAEIWAVAFSPSVGLNITRKLLASASADATIKLWDVKSLDLIYVAQGHRAAVRCLAFSPDGKWLASGDDDHTILLWDLANIL